MTAALKRLLPGLLAAVLALVLSLIITSSLVLLSVVRNRCSRLAR
ncbi:hypothetical protein [Fodinicola feengrottensis]|nr:hypothetical protein [Fodinicola feengrottensis]